jgi:hypothetical protein
MIPRTDGRQCSTNLNGKRTRTRQMARPMKEKRTGRLATKMGNRKKPTGRARATDVTADGYNRGIVRELKRSGRAYLPEVNRWRGREMRWHANAGPDTPGNGQIQAGARCGWRADSTFPIGQILFENRDACLKSSQDSVKSKSRII